MSKNSAYPLIEELGLEPFSVFIGDDSRQYVRASDLERVLEQGVKIDLVKLDNKIGISSTQDAKVADLIEHVEFLLDAPDAQCFSEARVRTKQALAALAEEVKGE